MFRMLNGFGNGNERMTRALVAVALALATILCYWGVQGHDFVDYDDGDYVFDNPAVRAGLTWSGVGWAFQAIHASNWHPMTWLSHMADCEMFGLEAGRHHLISLGFHTLNAVLLFAVLWALTRRLWPAAFVAGLFALHPLHVESVAWVSERKDVLSYFFGMLAMLAYVRYVVKSGIRSSMSEHRNPRAWGSYGLALLCFALSLMSKPMLVTLPFLLLLLDYWPLRRTANGDASSRGNRAAGSPRVWRGLVFEKLPFFALSIAASIVTFLAQRGTTVMSLESFGLTARLTNVSLSYVTYLRRLVWPSDLAFFYPLTQRPAWEGIVGGLLLLAVTGLVIWKRRDWPYALVGWLWFVGTLVPVIGLVQVGEQAMADRYTYLPAVGVFIGLTWGADAWLRCQRSLVPVATGLALLALACCGLLTWKQVGYWQNSRALLERALKVTDDNFLAHNNLGVILAREGDVEEAAAHFRTAIEAKPTYARAHRNLAGALVREGRLREAADVYRTAADLAPNDPEALRHLGTTLAQLGRLDEAAAPCARAVALAPRDALARYDYALILSLQGNPAAAAAQLRESLRLNPDDGLTHFQLALTLERMRDWRGALEELEAAARLRPRWPEVLMEQAWVLATADNADVRSGPFAVQLAEQAIALAQGGNPAALAVLAAALAESGQFEAAVEWTRQAIALAEKQSRPDLVATNHARLGSYQSGRPWRQ